MQCSCKEESTDLQLSSKDVKTLDDILEHYHYLASNTIGILQLTQEYFGYLPIPALTYISEKTGVKETKLYGVATFYTQFRMSPIGKNLIMLCKGTACHVNGAGSIEKTINEELGIQDGETTDDGLFTLFNVACLGCCSLAPVMMINGETYGSLDAQKTVEVIRHIREESK